MTLFPESVLGGGTLLSFRRLFAALYIYSFYLHPSRIEISARNGTIRDFEPDNAQIAARYNIIH